MRHPGYWTFSGERLTARVLSWFILAIAAGCCHEARAQWVTQSNNLTNGWNAVYLHVDASHTNLSGLIRNFDPIDEVWLWTAALPPGLSVATPPDETSSQWVKWTKAQAAGSALQTLPGNSALLVKVSSTVSSFVWNVKGRPVAPSYRWTLTGLNFIGFPTTPTPPKFDKFLAEDAQTLNWIQHGEIFRYQGGNTGPPNPVLVSGSLQRSIPVVRQQAYWVRACELTNQIYNHYFGPFQVTGGGSSGIRFGDSQGQTRLYLKNMTDKGITVTLRKVDSEVPPTGPAPLPLPLIVRESFSTSNLTFSYFDLKDGARAWPLAANGLPGSEVEIVLGVDRSQMAAMAGTNFAGILRFTDSLGFMQVDIGASATTSSRAGLWVGNAVVDQVSQYLKPYAKSTNANLFHEKLNQLGLTLGTNNPTGTNVLSFAVGPDGHRYEWDTNTGRILVFGGPQADKGNYLLDGPIKLALDKVARPFPLRLIVHNNGSTSRLLQRAYLGQNSTSQQIVATVQSAVQLAGARRLSAVHLPSSDEDGPWPFGGAMEEGGTLQTTIDLPYWKQSSNPFLHTYHPDHDNKDALYSEELPAGRESYDTKRVMRLGFDAPGLDFESRTRGGTSLTGSYAETISLRANNNTLKEFNVLGTFTLTRITDTATLVTNP